MPELSRKPGCWSAISRFGLGLAIAAPLFVAVVIGTARWGDQSLWPAAPGAPVTEVFIVSHGYHAGIIVPRKALAEQGSRRGLAALALQSAVMSASQPAQQSHPMSARLLLIDDDARLATMVTDYLGHAGFEVETAASLAAGRRSLAEHAFDALVLDLMLPDGDGLDLCRELRGESRTRHLPLLMLTARGEPMDRIVGLELGADDYLPKPFEPRELLARVKALLRRAAPQPADDDVLRFGRLEIDLGARVARLDGKVCDLTGHQFDLLVVLAQSPGRVLTRDQIMDSLKGHPLEAFDRSIDVHISRIRALIEDDPKAPRRVLTVRGAGYVFARKQDAEDTSQ